MHFLNYNLKKAAIFIILFILPLFSINMEQKKIESSWFSKPFSWMSSLLQTGLYDFSTNIKGTTAQYVNIINVKKQNEQLRQANDEMKVKQLKFEELEKENIRLHALLEFKATSQMQLVPAHVIGRDLVPDHNTITISKGTQHGIKAGQAVMTTKGALGYIYRPEILTAHVLLLSDRYSVVDALLQRTRARGIIEGKGSGGAVLKYLEKSSDVQPGDLVVTGGLDNIFPKGFPVAIVESAEKKSLSVSLKVDLKPIVEPHQVEEVFVVLNAASEDLSEKYTTPEPH